MFELRPHTLYLTDHEIPALGAKPGDLVVIRPAHATDPLMIVRRFDRNILPTILDEFERLRPGLTAAAPTPPEGRWRMQAREGRGGGGCQPLNASSSRWRM